MPDIDYLTFGDFNLYLSSGATTGTIVYPPGASFNCDAVIFDHKATVDVCESKSTRRINVSGTPTAIEMGLISISGYKEHEKVRVGLKYSIGQQGLLVDGGVRILDNVVAVKANVARYQCCRSRPSSLPCRWDFSEDLVFALEGKMR